MKTAIPHILLTILLTVVSSCKKGEDDPFLSFKSRDARLRGEWKLVKMTGTYTDGLVEPGVSDLNVYTVDYDGTTVTRTENDSVTGSATWSVNYTFEKKGIFKSVSLLDGAKEEYTDYWSWGNTDKKKTRLIIDEEDHFDFELPDYYSVNEESYSIKRLSGKDLVLVQSESYTNGPDTFTADVEMTFEKK